MNNEENQFLPKGSRANVEMIVMKVLIGFAIICGASGAYFGFNAQSESKSQQNQIDSLIEEMKSLEASIGKREDFFADSENLEIKQSEMAEPKHELGGISLFNENQKKEGEQDSCPVEVVDPRDSKIMISFNNESAGEDAEKLCNFLNRHGKKAFCSRIYCARNLGDWRRATEIAAVSSEVFIPLMTDGWQKSNECQYETEIIKNRVVNKSVKVIPVYYKSFDLDYDKSSEQFYKVIWRSFQSIQSKENNDKWMEAVLQLLPEK